eukprot:2662664-Rhodomonas_salina.2
MKFCISVYIAHCDWQIWDGVRILVPVPKPYLHTSNLKSIIWTKDVNSFGRLSNLHYHSFKFRRLGRIGPAALSLSAV